MDHLYQLTGVARTHRTRAGSVSALRGVDLTIDPGEVVAITGPSGAGKSTLLHLLGLLDRPTGGRLRFSGVALEAFSDRALAVLRRDTIGFVFQQFHLIPTLTAAQNVEAALPAGTSPRRGRARADELLAQVGLADHADRLPGRLSGGEQQRVAIARALANHPSVLLADEPTGNLDAETGRSVLALLDELHRATGVTVVLVTHDPAIAAAVPRVVEIRDGRPVEPAATKTA
ncbi:ABC transporter related protein [Patulibacter medicamentivorans]|uniref:ABC transporter related protein n=1 Tax=Patulibacter medicamentivorans TaxID=1097667 RepID=H0E1C3_9ACTN|nr:ABC transporter ATP-binding protein [Patulibacter medicamentivorans]EHN12562.1 ABC transporter related protein [Patulibacter medicamentivorans]